MLGSCIGPHKSEVAAEVEADAAAHPEVGVADEHVSKCRDSLQLDQEQS